MHALVTLALALQALASRISCTSMCMSDMLHNVIQFVVVEVFFCSNTSNSKILSSLYGG